MRLVLHRHRADPQSLGAPSVEPLGEILRINPVVSRVEFTVAEVAAGFHPGRRAPWCAQQRELGVERFGLLHHRYLPEQVAGDGKLAERRVRLAGRHVVVGAIGPGEAV